MESLDPRIWRSRRRARWRWSCRRRRRRRGTEQKVEEDRVPLGAGAQPGDGQHLMDNDMEGTGKNRRPVKPTPDRGIWRTCLWPNFLHPTGIQPVCWVESILWGTHKPIPVHRFDKNTTEPTPCSCSRVIVKVKVTWDPCVFSVFAFSVFSSEHV